MPSNEKSPPDGHTPSEQKEETGNISWRQALGTVGLALAIPWMIGVPTLIGWWIDQKYQIAPIGFIAGLVVGLLGTALDIVQLLRRFGQFK